jgi:hypothetical protein
LAERGNQSADEQRVTTWLEDITRDWCVIHVESARQCKLIKVDYVITGGVVVFGPPVEVTRRRIYDPVSTPSRIE